MSALSSINQDTDEDMPSHPSREEIDADLPTATLTTAANDWWAHARCNVGDGRLTQLFFSEELQDIARAKHICATCPAMIPCLEGALARREPWGVWGGQLFLNGRILAGKRRRGRPPKQARAEDQLPQVPIPEQLASVATVRIA